MHNSQQELNEIISDSTNTIADSVETELSCIQSGDVDKVKDLMNTKYKNDLWGFWALYSYDIGHAGIYGLMNVSLKSILTRDDFIKLIEGAATAGHLSILKFVFAKVPEIFRASNVIEISQLNNRVSVLEWLQNKGFDCGEGVQASKKSKVVSPRTKKSSVVPIPQKYFKIQDIVEAFTLKDDGTPSFLDIVRGQK